MSKFKRLCVCILMLLTVTLIACGPTATRSPIEISIPLSSPTPRVAEDHYKQIVELALTDLDAFWSEEFARVWPSLTYTPPEKLQPYTRENLGTIDAKWIDNAVYFHGTKTLAWDEDWLRLVNGEFTRENDMGPIAILELNGDITSKISHRDLSILSRRSCKPIATPAFILATSILEVD